VVIGGLLEFIFVFDHSRGSMLLVLTLSLVVSALDIPISFGFSLGPLPRPGHPLTESGTRSRRSAAKRAADVRGPHRVARPAAHR
jgi:hypothetical protein